MPVSPSQHTTKDTTAASKSFNRLMENDRLKMQQNTMNWPPTRTDPMNLEMEKFESSLHDVDAPPWLFVLFWFLRLKVPNHPSSRPSSASWRRLGSLPTVGAFPVWKLNANKLVHYSVKQARCCNTRLKERNTCLSQAMPTYTMKKPCLCRLLLRANISRVSQSVDHLYLHGLWQKYQRAERLQKWTNGNKI